MLGTYDCQYTCVFDREGFYSHFLKMTPNLPPLTKESTMSPNTSASAGCDTPTPDAARRAKKTKV